MDLLGVDLAYVYAGLDEREKYILEQVISFGRQAEMFGEIPIEVRTPTLSMAAVRFDSWNIRFVPDEVLSDEIIIEAVSRDGQALLHVPEERKTREICEIAFKHDLAAFPYIPKEFLTKEMCEKVVNKDGFILLEVPKELLTREMCETAINDRGMMLSCVPRELLTREMCEKAVEQEGSSILRDVPQEWRSAEMYAKAKDVDVKINEMWFVHVLSNPVPDNVLYWLRGAKSFDAARAAKEVNPKAMDVNLAEFLMQRDPAVFPHLSDSVKTEQMCRQALKHDDKNLKYVPEQFRPKQTATQINERSFRRIKPVVKPKKRGFKL